VVVRRRCEFELRKAEARKHILEGLDIALSNIDAVIKVIKTSKSREEAHDSLMKKFKLSSIQADAILEMRLQTLVGLERQKIQDELKQKIKEINDLKAILKDAKKILKIVKDELNEVKEKFGDERRTKVMASAVGEFKEEDLVPAEENIFLMSQDGFIKRVQPTIVKAQHRGGKGVIGFETKEEDNIQHIFQANTHDNLLFFTKKGRVFQLKAYEIPMASRTSRGKSIFNFLELPQNEEIAAILTYNGKPTDLKNSHLVMLTKNGVIKKTSLDEFSAVRRSGLIAIKLKGNDELLWAKSVDDKDEIIILTANGQALRFKESELRAMGRNASGVTGIRLKKGDEVRGFDILKSGDEKTATLLVVMANGFGKRTSVKEYRLQKRSGQGTKTAKITDKTGKIASSQILMPDIKEVLVISKKGILIKTELESISEQSRVTQGVRIIKLEGGDEVAGIVCL
ncbi:MAG TPA: DNA gyrase C-terminal beta-propeller domain-containing protein, partial [Candidatus Paceibacterota bacterium]|nr:DNA gyrase C-terminal beta-propeller domain-containing protein [Candidatus Paceibacterota bacterium]HPT40605.1 DNA gyrase C-terminal beta-propeller domain-containing protein [Candidatus Paceibacterota bacterium]